MTLQERVAKTLTRTRIGQIVYQALRRAVHLGRKVAHPNTPTHLGRCTVAFRDRRFSVLHRRTYADRLAIKQCFDQAQYDMPGRAHGAFIEHLYQQIAADGKRPLILDCGANIGASVLWFTARYPKAHIVAVEPAADNFALMQLNCAGLDVDLVNAAVSESDGLARLADPGWGTMAYRLSQGDQGAEVPMVTVASLLASKPDAKYVPFILKIDIEGGEKALFEGDCSAISRFPLIIIEPHDWLMPGEGSSLPFFRFHAASGREFCMNNENIASIDFRRSSSVV